MRIDSVDDCGEHNAWWRFYFNHHFILIRRFSFHLHYSTFILENGFVDCHMYHDVRYSPQLHVEMLWCGCKINFVQNRWPKVYGCVVNFPVFKFFVLAKSRKTSSYSSIVSKRPLFESIMAAKSSADIEPYLIIWSKFAAPFVNDIESVPIEELHSVRAFHRISAYVSPQFYQLYQTDCI